MSAEYCEHIINDSELKMTDGEIEVDAEEVFEQAAYDHGHSGYSGSFAEKTGEGVTVHRDIQFNNEDEACKYVQDDLDSNKWGPPDVVAIVGVGWYIGGWCSA